MKAPASWVARLAKYLPYHQDQYFLSLGVAVWGQYQPKFKSEGPQVQGTAPPEFDRFCSTADRAIDRFQKTKGLRGHK